MGTEKRRKSSLESCFAQARIVDVLIGVDHNGGDVFLPLDDHCRFLTDLYAGPVGRLLMEELIYLSRRFCINSGHVGKIG